MNKKSRVKKISIIFNKFSTKVTKAAGRPIATISAFLLVFFWALSGPIFQFSDSWQLFINTTTTIITFLMVFIIQQSQNKDTIALQLKLNELIACNERASNRLIDIEDLTEDELVVLKKFYVKLSELAEQENDIHTSHSIDDAAEYHEEKRRKKKKVDSTAKA